jgi:hypothetical protein
VVAESLVDLLARNQTEKVAGKIVLLNVPYRCSVYLLSQYKSTHTDAVTPIQCVRGNCPVPHAGRFIRRKVGCCGLPPALDRAFLSLHSAYRAAGLSESNCRSSRG